MKTSHTKMNGLNINCFLQCYFKPPLPKMPSFYPAFTCPIAHTMKLANKSFHFSWLFQALKKKVEVRVPSYKKQNFNYENCFRKFSLHVSLHVCTNFKKEKKIQHLQINICTCKKKNQLLKKKNRVVKTGSDSKTISIPIMSKKNYCVFHRICIQK